MSSFLEMVNLKKSKLESKYSTAPDHLADEVCYGEADTWYFELGDER